MKKVYIYLSVILICGCSTNPSNIKKQNMEVLSEESVLNALDHSIDGDYDNFIDLGHGYFELANCRLTLFKDDQQWAMVFEKFGYNARAGAPIEVEIAYFGNCLKNLSEYNGRKYNADYIGVENDILDALKNQKDIITIRGEKITIPLDYREYKKLNIPFYPDNEIYPGVVVKWLAEKHPELTRATDAEVRRCIPKNLKKIMTLDEWHQDIYHKYDPETPPSKQETFQMLAKVLVTGDTTYYRPTKEPNTHWSFWPESGGL